VIQEINANEDTEAVKPPKIIYIRRYVRRYAKAFHCALRKKKQVKISGDKREKGGGNDADPAEKGSAQIESMGKGVTTIVTCTGVATAIA